MPGLYANRDLSDELSRLGIVDRFPRSGHAGAECVLTLAVATASTGHVQAVLCLEVVAKDGRTVSSIPLGYYPIGSQDLAYADATMARLKLGLSLRRADPARGWIVDPVAPDSIGPAL